MSIGRGEADGERWLDAERLERRDLLERRDVDGVGLSFLLDESEDAA